MQNSNISEKEELVVFVIDRSMWITGEDIKKTGLKSKLIRKCDGKKCCLGFFAEQICNAKPDDILEQSTPHSTFHILNWPKSFVDERYCNINHKRQKEIVDNIIMINDYENFSREIREVRIAEKFAELGYKAVFVGEYPEHY